MCAVGVAALLTFHGSRSSGGLLIRGIADAASWLSLYEVQKLVIVNPI